MTKVPKKAKRVFKGVIFEVYQWPQKMFDGTTQTFEMIKRQSTIIVIASVKNRIVVLKQKQPDRPWYLSMVAGRMDKPGESPLAAAKRELLEETGFRAKRIKLWQKLNHESHKIDHTLYIFIARNLNKVAPLNLDAGEKIQVQLYTFDQFLKLYANPHFIDGEIKHHLIKARLDRGYKARLRKLIFG